MLTPLIPCDEAPRIVYEAKLRRQLPKAPDLSASPGDPVDPFAAAALVKMAVVPMLSRSIDTKARIQ